MKIGRIMKNDFTALGISCLLFAGGVGLIVSGGIRLQCPGWIAEIEQLRSDTTRVNPAQAHDVYGQVTKTNQEIKSWQYYNRQWWADAFIPDAVDSIQLIELPK